MTDSQTQSAYRETVDLLNDAERQITEEWTVPYNVAIDRFGVGAAHKAQLLITFGGQRRISTLHELLTVLNEMEIVSGIELETETYTERYGDAVKLTVFLEKQ